MTPPEAFVSQEVSTDAMQDRTLAQAGARILGQVFSTATWEGCEKNLSSRPASCREEKSRRH